VLAVITREELVVLVELCTAAVEPASISAAGAAANPVAGFVVVVVVVVLAELLVVATLVTLFALADAAATLGTAVHLRPSMVVKKAPDGRPLDAIFTAQSLSENGIWRDQSLRNEEKEKIIMGQKYKHKKGGSGEAKMMAARAV
jgi:hypothetical protein